MMLTWKYHYEYHIDLIGFHRVGLPYQIIEVILVESIFVLNEASLANM